MTLLLLVLVLVVAANCCFMAYLIDDVTARYSHAEREPGNIFWLGVVSFFQFLLSTFGISDFAVGAAVYSRLKWVPAKMLPGTVNTACVIPVAVMALIYITSIEVGLATLLVPIAAQVAGAYISVRFVVKMPARPIKICLALGMFVTVLRIAAEVFGFFPAGGTATSLEAGRLALLGCLCLLYGALNNAGIGCFSPIIATTYALGLDPAAAFPIMMGASTFSVPWASIQFIKYGCYARKVTVVSSICGTLGVLAAAFVVKDMNIPALKLLVAGVLFWSACSMLAAAVKNAPDAAPAGEKGEREKSEKTEGGLSIVGRLTIFCLALVLLCTVSLISVFVRNFHLISSDYVETTINEHNSRLSDNVYAYLREHENVLLSARAVAARFMSDESAEPPSLRLERFRRYLEDTSRVLDDISTLYCTTNQVWNQPGGYAVFSRPWDVPRDWDNTKRPWFLAAKSAADGGSVAYSKPYADSITDDIILDMSVNVYDAEGNDIGVVSESITIEALGSMLRRGASLEGQQVFLIDSDGTFVVHPDKEMAARGNFFDVFGENGLEEYRDEFLSASAAGHFSATVGGMAVYSSSIPAAGWHVVSVVPADKIASSINDQIVSLFLTPLLIIVFMLLVVLISLLIIVRRESRDKLTAERHTREKDYFIARMSHEIRTPMNAVIGMSELARQDYGTPRGLEYLAGIKNAGASLLVIINDILDFSRIESGRLDLRAVPYKTADLLNDVLAVVSVQMAGKPIELSVDAPCLPGVMVGDAGRVKQVLLNLLSNAVKYTDEGFIRLRLSALNEEPVLNEDQKDTVRLVIVAEDSGIGIRPEDMPKLFGDFARLDEKRNSAIEGTGLGLSIARSMCAAMGGGIEAKSEYGKGSVFTATIIQGVADWNPMEHPGVISAARNIQSKQRVSFAAPDAEVLVVDDFPSNLMVTEGLLRPYKMRVSTCLNGREAVKLVSSHPFDLVLMDHMMPEMDGMEALQAIRALGHGVLDAGSDEKRFTELPIVVLTAHAVSGMREMFLADGFDDFLSKPIETDKLDALLRFWIPAAKRQSVPDNAEKDVAPASNRGGGDNVPLQGLLAEGRSPKASIPGIAKAELAAQRLDLLNHYRWHFANGLPADLEYYGKFTALLEAVAADMDISPHTRGMVADLTAAGRRGNPEEINRLLPGTYEALKSAAHEATARAAAAARFKDALPRLKTALEKGDAPGADAAMEELRAMDDLSAQERELYIFLYDALLMGETEKAAGGLAVWLKM